jgi:hypothetical protein
MLKQNKQGFNKEKVTTKVTSPSRASDASDSCPKAVSTPAQISTGLHRRRSPALMFGA